MLQLGTDTIDLYINLVCVLTESTCRTRHIGIYIHVQMPTCTDNVDGPFSAALNITRYIFKYIKYLNLII